MGDRVRIRVEPRITIGARVRIRVRISGGRYIEISDRVSDRVRVRRQRNNNSYSTLFHLD